MNILTTLLVSPLSLPYPEQITIEAMKSDIDEVALQGIEFWSNVCDEEMDLAIEATEVSPPPNTHFQTCFNSINKHKATLQPTNVNVHMFYVL